MRVQYIRRRTVVCTITVIVQCISDNKELSRPTRALSSPSPRGACNKKCIASARPLRAAESDAASIVRRSIGRRECGSENLLLPSRSDDPTTLHTTVARGRPEEIEKKKIMFVSAVHASDANPRTVSGNGKCGNGPTIRKFRIRF